MIRKDDLVIGSKAKWTGQEVMILDWSVWGIHAPGTRVWIRLPDGSVERVYNFELEPHERS